MEISMRCLDCHLDHYEIKEALAEILHSPKFTLSTMKRPLNFKVVLKESRIPGLSNNGTGSLIVPIRQIGVEFLEKVRRKEIIVTLRGRRIFFDEAGQRPSESVVRALTKVPYQDPKIDKQREEKIRQLANPFRLGSLQFGCWLRYPFQNEGVFAVEWEKTQRSYISDQDFYAVLRFEYDHKLIRIQLGDPLRDHIAHSIVLKFSNIRELWAGYDYGNPYVCFDLITPPILESERFNRQLTGVIHEDEKKYRQRVGAVDDGHESVAPYAHHVRITLYRDLDLEEFVRMCDVADLRKPKEAKIDAQKHEFFTPKRLSQVRKRLERLPWPIFFQVEAMLHNGLLNTEALQRILLDPIVELARDQPNTAGVILKYFVQSFRQKSVELSVLEFFQQICAERLNHNISSLDETSSNALVLCHRVTFTPTRMTLEGPYPIQSNRVLRRYKGFHDHFLRVDFRDEDRLQFKWDREVDGTSFLRERVGKIMKNGFVLAGRNFEFLAYSSSSLRGHAVWFMNPFEHPTEGSVTAAKVRKSLGDFTEILTCPAKFAARLSQAFTATYPSIRISRDQWNIVPDLGKEPYLFTDGTGTISPELGHLIFHSLCLDNPQLSKLLEPDVYQIRFLSFKGVVRIDPLLTGIRMCLRPSMNKFVVHENAEADIEIARAFYYPGKMFLNRPLIMLLEDRGVEKEAFLDLQNQAVVSTRLAKSSIHNFNTLLRANNLGGNFSLSSILQKLSEFGLDFNHSDIAQRLSSPFLSRLIDCGTISVLRDIKYRARIHVPKGWSLPGVADEGPAYISQGYDPKKVFTLKEGEIYACIQAESDSEPIYLKRNCMISRSPTLHPGDVQRVWAVGKPPEDMICSFKGLKNCVVLPSTGDRSLASCLSGGDLDGDLYDVCQNPELFASIHQDPAEYPPVERKEIAREELIDPETGEIDPERIIPHVCDFVVEYINSDVLGLLSDMLLIRADQSSEGIFDPGCIDISKLCSQAVDYPKNGVAVKIQDAPRRLIHYKPDWKENEIEGPRKEDFYRSERAIGYLYRAVELAARSPVKESACNVVRLQEHPIYRVLRETVSLKVFGAATLPKENLLDRIRLIFKNYVDELRFICATHTLADHHDVTLSEEEIVIGTILSRCSQHRWRQERIYCMRLHSENLVKQVKAEFYPTNKYNPPTSESDTKHALQVAWSAWQFTIEELAKTEAGGEFGLNSFGWIALQAVFDCLAVL